MDLSHPLIHFDFWLFEKINLDWTHPFFDVLFPAITDLHKNPVALSLLVPILGYWFWKKKSYAVKCFLLLALSVGFSDLVSYRLIKKNVRRDRPQFSGVELNLRTHQHTGTSFPSNHAANIFAAATALTCAHPALWPASFLVAGLVGYSRVYVGVHFPLDVLAGAILGASLALIVWFSFRRWILRSQEKRPESRS